MKNKKKGALSPAQTHKLIKKLTGWKLGDGQISKTFSFEDHYQTMAFVNALAWISHRKNHHPDLQVGYNKCVVAYSTHSVGGLSPSDFTCAAAVDALLKV